MVGSRDWKFDVEHEEDRYINKAGEIGKNHVLMGLLGLFRLFLVCGL